MKMNRCLLSVYISYIIYINICIKSFKLLLQRESSEREREREKKKGFKLNAVSNTSEKSLFCIREKEESTSFVPIDRVAIKRMGKEVLDTYFISHVSALVQLEDQQPYRQFLKSWSEKILPEKPKYILVISGHWQTIEPAINVPECHETLQDFQNGTPELYKIRYPAPGSPELAIMVNDVLVAAGFKPVHVDTKRGLDHGAWAPLVGMYPEADIPVGQLSFQPHEDGTYHLKLGKALAPLREQGVLILGSGNVTTNLGDTVAPWAFEFDNYVKDALLEGRYDDVAHALEKYPQAKMEHPDVPFHFYPLLVAIGAAGGEKAKAELIHHSFSVYTVSNANYSFSSTE